MKLISTNYYLFYITLQYFFVDMKCKIRIIACILEDHLSTTIDVFLVHYCNKTLYTNQTNYFFYNTLIL